MKKFTLRYMVALILLVLNAVNLKAEVTTKEASATIIAGKVIDETTKMPVEYASIAVYSAIDSSLITGTICDIDGNFKINSLSTGYYYIQVNIVGFEKKETDKINISNRRLTVNVGEISLKPLSVEIDDIVVASERSRVEYKIDKKVIDVDKDLTLKCETASKALKNIPFVKVDTEGNVTLRGSSDFIVFVDGKPSDLNGNDALKQIPAAAIRQIEVITNPAAKTEYDEKSGIINVIMQKNKTLGFKEKCKHGLYNSHKRTDNVLPNYDVRMVDFLGGIYFFDNNFRSDLTMMNADVI